MKHQENFNGWRIVWPILAITLLLLGGGIVEVVAQLVGAVAGAR